MSLAILFHFLCAQHVSDINISIIRSLRLCCWITTLVVLFLVRCLLEIWCGWVWVVSVLHQISNTHRTKNKMTDLVIQHHSYKLLMMDILMSETCWANKKWNKIAGWSFIFQQNWKPRRLEIRIYKYREHFLAENNIFCTLNHFSVSVVCLEGTFIRQNVLSSPFLFFQIISNK